MIALFRRADPALRFWTAIALIVAFSIPLRRGGLTPDVSWLLSMCQRMLDGETAYVDIFETTPPAPMLLYMPGAVIARFTGLAPDIAVLATAYAAVLCALYLSWKILPAQIQSAGPSEWIALAPAAFILFMLANDVFAQREYFAAAWMLPIVCSFLRFEEIGSWPARGARWAAAAFAGLAIAIKPPLFVLPLLALSALFVWRRRSLDFSPPSGVIHAVLIGAAVTAATLAAFPEYLGGVTTLMRDVYIPIRSKPVALLHSTAFLSLVFCLFLIFALCVWRKMTSPAILPATAAISFAAIFLLQGKFFNYQVFPAIFFSGVAFVAAVAAVLRAHWAARRSFALGVPLIYVGVALSVAAVFFWSDDDKRPRMKDRTWAAALDRPTAAAISPDIATAFPLAQEIDAVWIDRIHSQWVARYTRFALANENLGAEQEARYAEYFRRDIQRTVALIKGKRPDIIIEDRRAGWLRDELLADDPALLKDYDVAAEEGVFRILKRRTPPGAD